MSFRDPAQDPTKSPLFNIYRHKSPITESRTVYLVLGQFKLVLFGFRRYRVSRGLVCLYTLEKVKIWSGDTMPDIQTTEYSATQLVHSIKIRLSHAIEKRPKYGFGAFLRPLFGLRTPEMN